MSLPDGFLTTGCETVDDCPLAKCQQVKCNIVTRMCEYKDKVCTPDNECTSASCELATGSCIQRAANDQMACTSTSGGVGFCMSGVCQGIPSCAPTSFFSSSLSCSSSAFSSSVEDSNEIGLGSGAPNVSAYPCAPTEVGPEAVFNFSRPSTAIDEDVTLTLRLVDPAGKDLADQSVVDLDLIVLEDTCTASSVCKNAAVTGGFAGVTTGTSKERVTFRALAGKKYFVVVDGKAADQVHEFIVEAEACGVCQPTDGTRIDCNTSVPIATGTASGAASLTNYTCGTAMTAVASPGKEIPFYFKSQSSVQRNVTAKVVGGTAAYNMLALSNTSSGQCDPTKCIGFSSAASGDQSLTWTIDQSFGSNFTRYWLVVDANDAAADVNFGLTLACDPYCMSPSTLRCGSGSDIATVSSTTVGGLTLVDHWGPDAGCDGLTGLVGPETTVKFTPTPGVGGADYTIQLGQKVAGPHLTMTVLDGGTSSTAICNPTFACLANTVIATTGFSGTRTTTDTLAAGLKFRAVAGRFYYIVVDGTDAAGAGFDMKVIGEGGATGSGCL